MYMGMTGMKPSDDVPAYNQEDTHNQP